MKNFSTLFALCALVLIVLVCALCVIAPAGDNQVAWWSLFSGLALGAGFLMKDAQLKKTKALPAAASTSVVTDGIDTGKGAYGEQLADVEYLLTVPALTTTMLPDTKTATYIIEHDTDSAFGTVATLNVGTIVQTGAGGAGAATTTFRFRLPSTANRYIRAKCTFGADTTTAAAVSMTLEALT